MACFFLDIGKRFQMPFLFSASGVDTAEIGSPKAVRYPMIRLIQRFHLRVHAKDLFRGEAF